MKVFVKAGQGGEFVQAILWMLGSGLFFSCLNAQIRYLTETMHPLEITFFRNLFGLVFMLPWLFRSGLAGLRTGRLKLYFWRTAVGLSSMMMSFSALALLPLSLAVALSFTAPLFTTMGAALVLVRRSASGAGAPRYWGSAGCSSSSGRGPPRSISACC